MKRKTIEYKRFKRRQNKQLDPSTPVEQMYLLGVDELAEKTFKQINRELFYDFNRIKRIGR